MTEALILVDIQNDFVPGGALAVPQGDQVIPVANRLIRRFDLVVATKDWHPADHGSFASQHPGANVGDIIELGGVSQVLWPDHCIQDSPGAEFVAGLNTDALGHVFHKGTDRTIDSYSGFFDNGRLKATGLAGYLRQRDVTTVYIAGLTTDYCAKFTALDAGQLGFDTYLIEDACRGVELRTGDVAKAIEEMNSAGVSIVNSVALLRG